MLPLPDLMRKLLPHDVAVEEGPLQDDVQGLLPEELSIIRHAVIKRRSEFATGRVFARRALATFGAPVKPLLPNDAGIPQWPERYTGSITHCAGYCAVAIARTHDVNAIGIDIERIGRISADIIRHIATAREIREILAPLGPEERQRIVTLLFSAKEAFFKSLHGSSLPQLTDIELEIDTAGQKFQPIGFSKGIGSFSFSGDFLATAWLVC